MATLDEAVADCTAVVGTTARLGLYRQHVRTPREWAPELLQTAARGRVALVFGREDNGLANDEVARCTHLIRIPTSTDYVSINLAQAVMICCYELFVAGGVFEVPGEKSPPAPAAQRNRLLTLWRQAMLAIGFLHEETADHMMQGFQRIFSRGVKSEDDAHIMMGVARRNRGPPGQYTLETAGTARRFRRDRLAAEGAGSGKDANHIRPISPTHQKRQHLCCPPRCGRLC